MVNLDPFFRANRIAVIGASRTSGKVGNVIVKQLKDHKKVFPVNPNAKNILGLKCYNTIDSLPSVDLAVIATPAETVSDILFQCRKKRISHVVIISAGFKEIGNIELEKELQTALRKNKITCIGPNCLGILDTYNKLDMLFLPSERLRRPQKGAISFISQSGAVGSAIIDLAAYEGYGISKFVSYGNAANVDETDLLDYFARDKKTDIICLYVEGIKDGKRFLKVAKKCKKPIIAIKGGVSEFGSQAAASHTGSLAGDAKIYFGAFNQANMITTSTLQDLFKFAKFFEKVHAKVKGDRVQIITNGGGYGILTADAVAKYSLQLAKPGREITKLKTKLPRTAVLNNPIDLLGDATTERYQLAVNAAVQDKNNDAIILVALTQTPLLDEKLVSVVQKAYKKSKKPIVLVTTGSEYALKLRKKFEDAGLPVFTFPDQAVRALAKFMIYCMKK
ncbi:CoA-binding protein [Candidatus Woesearchaeota archaeon CG10_big_fil_rev_8_21_14_0_10_37_12]|nr:MAG: CoA-binding protein [Candidatus Woesearchaeota archaeon CG10_big_fil_rev_8_21_14_0_10_37_12]